MKIFLFSWVLFSPIKAFNFFPLKDAKEKLQNLTLYVFKPQYFANTTCKQKYI